MSSVKNNDVQIRKDINDYVSGIPIQYLNEVIYEVLNNSLLVTMQLRKTDCGEDKDKSKRVDEYLNVLLYLNHVLFDNLIKSRNTNIYSETLYRGLIKDILFRLYKVEESFPHINKFGEFDIYSRTQSYSEQLSFYL